MIDQLTWRPARLTLLAWVGWLIVGGSAPAQERADTADLQPEQESQLLVENVEPSANEIQAIFRISQHFLDDLTDQRIVADIPLCATVARFRCTGTIHGEGTVSVALEKSGEVALFSVASQGNGRACVRGVRGPIVAFGSAWGPFASKTMVRFDGRRFFHLSTEPTVSVRGRVQRVTGRRDRPLGRAIGAGVRPLAEGILPRALEQAVPVANGYLKRFVIDLADQITIKLNAKTPIEESVNRLFPDTVDWVFQTSSDATSIQAAYGPPGAAVPHLPVPPETAIAETHLELWLRSTSEEAALLSDLSKNPLARQLVRRYLESTLPELASLAPERSVDAVGPWVLIRVGDAAAE